MLFKALKKINYPLRHLVCDEHDAIHFAANYHFHGFNTQLCTNHFLRNQINFFKPKSNPKHADFINQLHFIFDSVNLKQFRARCKFIVKNYQHNTEYMYVMAHINRNLGVLTNYLKHKQCPQTNNLIELFNSHLEARLHPLKGFNSYKTANLWLNAYFMNRRLSIFTSCSKKFKNLNGKCSLSFTAKDNAPKISLLKRVHSR